MTNEVACCSSSRQTAPSMSTACHLDHYTTDVYVHNFKNHSDHLSLHVHEVHIFSVTVILFSFFTVRSRSVRTGNTNTFVLRPRGLCCSFCSFVCLCGLLSKCLFLSLYLSIKSSGPIIWNQRVFGCFLTNLKVTMTSKIFS